MRGLAQLEQATPETAARRSRSTEEAPGASEATRASGRATARRSTSVWGRRQKLCLIGALITLVGLGWVGCLHLIRPRLIRTESMAPIHTWRLWHDLRHGIDQHPDWEALYHKSLRTYRRWRIVASFVAGVGVLVMASSLLAPSRRRGRRTRRPGPNAGARGSARAT